MDVEIIGKMEIRSEVNLKGKQNVYQRITLYI